MIARFGLPSSAHHRWARVRTRAADADALISERARDPLLGVSEVTP